MMLQRQSRGQAWLEPFGGCVARILIASVCTVSIASAAPQTPSAGSVVTIRVPQGGPVLLDSRCDESEWGSASRTAIGENATLLAQQDARTVYLCVPLPPDSYGTIDLYILPADATQPTNLHASAQVGERQRTASGWPEWTFGNHRGWYSPPVALANATVVDGRARLTFGAVPAREIAIEKTKFGGVRWRLMFEIRALGADKRGTMRFPVDASPDAIDSWATLDHAAAPTAARSTAFDTVVLDSQALGQTREIWIRAPEGCRTTACDLLVVLEAHAMFPLATAYAEVMQRMGRMAPLVIVGVPSRTPAERIAQFTPAPGDDERARFPEAGGSARFVRFLQDEVMPAITRGHRLSSRSTLAGHSLAGLFAVDALVSGARFENYVAISPTLGWNRQGTLDALDERRTKGASPTRRLYVSVAGLDSEPYRAAFDRLEEDVARRRQSSLRVETERFATDDHVSTVAPALVAAMKRLFVQPVSGAR